MAAARGRVFGFTETIEGPRSLAAFEARAGVDLKKARLIARRRPGRPLPEVERADGASSSAGAQVAALLGLKLFYYQRSVSLCFLFRCGCVQKFVQEN